MTAIEGVGPIVAREIAAWFKLTRHQTLIENLKKVLTIKAPEKVNEAALPLVGRTYVITGTLETMSRDEAKDLIKKNGGKVSSSVSAQTDYVVVGDAPGSKYDDAMKFGVKILTEKEFVILL